MPQPADLVKITMHFTLSGTTGPQDEAEFSIWGQCNFAPATGAEWDTALQALADTARDNWNTDADKAMFGPGVEFDRVIVGRHGADGKTLNERAAANAAGVWKGTGTGSLPWSSSVAVGLYTYTPGTFVSRAARRRGRIYLPPPARGWIADTNTGTISTNSLNGLLGWIKTWLNHVAGHHVFGTDGVWTPGVLSRASNSWAHLTDLSTDTKLDTQRRRERQQTATRVSLQY